MIANRWARGVCLGKTQFLFDLAKKPFLFYKKKVMYGQVFILFYASGYVAMYARLWWTIEDLVAYILKLSELVLKPRVV